MTDYQDFDLRVRRKGGRYEARVRDPVTHGLAQHTFQPPCEEVELATLARDLRSASRDPRGVIVPLAEVGASKHLRELGTRLFEAVFAGQVRDAWQARLACAPRHRVRLGLHLEEPELALWPWELLCDSAGRFLAFSSDVALVRRVAVSAPAEQRARGDKLRILVALAKPPGTPELDLVRERRLLERALHDSVASGTVEIQCLGDARLGGVHEALAAPAEVFHFIGHGRFDRIAGRGSLCFEGDDGRPDWVDGERLAQALRRSPGLGLVVLNACEGARGDFDESASDVAQVVCRHAAPTVVAMQFPISDDAAIAFTQGFYIRVARGEAIEQALAETREEMFVHDFRTHWLSPVLFARSTAAPFAGFSDAQAREESAAPPVDSSPPPKAESLERRARLWYRGRQALLVATIAFTAWVIAFPVRDLAWRLLGVQYGYPPPHPSPAPAWVRCPSPPGLDLAFVAIPAGTFQMGRSGGEADERPAHEVRLTRPFCLGTREVTQKQWRRVMGSNPSRPEGDDLPVTNVSWNGIHVFVEKLNASDPAHPFRLPTEAEREYAARGGSHCLYGFGDDPRDLRLFGNSRLSWWRDGFMRLAPVGRFRPTAWGLYDLHGNVAEWVEDAFALYPKGAVVEPRVEDSAAERVIRGGSFLTNAEHCDAAFRNHAQPDYSFRDLGFRLARDPV